MLADAKKASRKYDGAYFFIEPHRMGEAGQTVALEAGNPGRIRWPWCGRDDDFEFGEDFRVVAIEKTAHPRIADEARK
jgi:hypothetical protein